MRIKSIVPLSDVELRRIRDILQESKCPHESLKATFPHTYHHMTEDTIYFGAHSYDYTYAVYPVQPK